MRRTAPAHLSTCFLFAVALLQLVLLQPSLANAAAPGDPHASFSPLVRHLADATGQESATDVLVQPDGRVVVSILNDAEVDRRIVRLMPDGSLDPTFGVGGTWHLPREAATYVRSLALQPDGKIVFAGEDATRPAIVVGRLTSGGELDPTFAGDGLHVAIVPAGSAPIVEDVLVEPDGRVVVGGVIEEAPNGDELFVARLGADGTDDPGFPGTPYRTFGSPWEADDDAWGGMTRMSNGEFIVAGRALTDTYVHRVAATGGFVVTARIANLPSAVSKPVDVVESGAGRVIVLLGAVDGGDGSALASFDVAATPKLLTTGTVDGVLRPFPSTMRGHGLLHDASGALLVSGVDSSGEGVHRAVARVQSTGAIDPTFGTGGVRHLSGRSSRSFYLDRHAVATSPDGAITSAYHVTVDGMRRTAVEQLVGRIARVQLQVLAPSVPAVAGQVATATVRVTNAGPDPSGPGSVAFSVGEGLRVTSVNGPACTATAAGGTCRFDQVVPGASRDVLVRVRAGAAGEYGISATTRATTFDDERGDDTATSYLRVNAAPVAAAAPVAPAAKPTPLRLTFVRISGYQGRVLRGCGSARRACVVARASNRRRMAAVFVRVGATPVPSSGQRNVKLVMQQRVGGRWVTRVQPRVVVGGTGATDVRLPPQWRAARSSWRMRTTTVAATGSRVVVSGWLHYDVR
jgi:uncharacterized delta-60 repeat protein